MRHFLSFAFPAQRLISHGMPMGYGIKLPVAEEMLSLHSKKYKQLNDLPKTLALRFTALQDKKYNQGVAPCSTKQ